jgi:predicted transcriptional regulator
MEQSANVVLEKVVEILRRDNYRVFHTIPCDIDFCFELLAEHVFQQNPTLLIKIIENIDNIKSTFVHELKLLASLLSALPILLAKQNRRDSLQDNVIYNRKDLIAINLRTFENVIQYPMLPMAIAKKGGFFYDLDGKKMVTLKEEKNLSRKEIAEHLEVTPKAISQYEKSEMRASADHTKKLEFLLGESIIKPMNFIETVKEFRQEPLRLEKNLERKTTLKVHNFMCMINEIVEDAGFKTFWTRNSPYDLFVYQENEENHEITDYTLVGGAYYDKKMDPNRIILEETFIGEHLKEQQPKAMIYNDESVNPKEIQKEKIPYIKPQELKLLDHPQEFKKLIRERMKIKIHWI